MKHTEFGIRSMDEFQRGSEWRRWDLHLHTPNTKLANGFGGDSAETIWDKYIDILEKSPVEAFGITDYFSVDNYFQLIKKYKEKYPESKKVLFANVELRLSESINKYNDNPHLHIIFDNDLGKCSEQKLTTFLTNLKTISENDDDVRISCTDLNTKDQYMSASVAFNDVKDALKSTFGKTKPYMMAFPANNDGIKGTDSKSPRKISSSDQIDKTCDLFFGNAGNQKYFLGDNRYQNGQKKSEPKPVVSGSDAHSFADLERLDGNIQNFEPTWIKADLTFRGLKQICHEPEARVYIGGEPSVHVRQSNQATKFLTALHIDQYPKYNESNGQWFKKMEIPLNPELVAIIGNKGSGKSSLVDIIGLLADSRQYKYFSFLVDDAKNKKFKQKGYAENFVGEIHWKSSHTNKKRLSDNVDLTQPEAVKYLPQNYFEQLTNEIEIQEFRQAIEEVVFSHVSQSDKLGKSSFIELQEYKTQQSLNDTSTLKSRLRDINIKIVRLEEEADPVAKEKLTAKLTLKQQELTSLEKAKPQEIAKPSEQTPEQQKLSSSIENFAAKMSAINTSKAQAQEKLSNEKEQLQTLTSLLQSILSLDDYVQTQKSELVPVCNKLALSIDDIVTFNMDKTVVDEKITTAQKTIDQLEKSNQLLFSDDYDFTNLSSLPDLVAGFNYLKDQRNNLKKELGAPERKYQTYLEKLVIWETGIAKINGANEDPLPESINFIKAKLDYINNDLSGKLADLIVARKATCSDVFESKKQVLKFYSELKKSVDAKLLQVQTKDFSVNIDASFVLKNDFSDLFFSHINRNKRGVFYGITESQKYLNSLIDKVDWDNFESVFQFQETVFENLRNHDNQVMSVKEQVSSIKDFYNFIFSMEYFDAKYELRLGDKNLNELSPGEKGLLLLIFYLQLDDSNTPLVIDQPEDNLDNDSIFAVLAQCIRGAKKNRQVILVTHNPNLAVGADAEQIIYVKLDKSNNYKFSYECGSIENPKINKRIVDVLEGSQPAFVKRRLKYEI